MRGEATSVNDKIDKLNMKIDSKIDMLQQENSELKIWVSSLENQVEKLEVMSNKNTLVFVGIDDKPHDVHAGRSTITEYGASGNSGARRETWVECETKIRDFLDTVSRLGKEFSDRVQIEYVHRVRGTDSNRSIIPTQNLI